MKYFCPSEVVATSQPGGSGPTWLFVSLASYDCDRRWSTCICFEDLLFGTVSAAGEECAREWAIAKPVRGFTSGAFTFASFPSTSELPGVKKDGGSFLIRIGSWRPPLTGSFFISAELGLITRNSASRSFSESPCICTTALLFSRAIFTGKSDLLITLSCHQLFLKEVVWSNKTKEANVRTTN